MKFRTLWKRRAIPNPGAGADDAAEVDANDLPPINQWTGGSALASRAATIGLYALIVCGPIALAAQTLTGATAQPVRSVAAPAGDAEPGDRAVAGEVAQRAVTAWLTTPRGHEGGVADLLPGFTGHEKPYALIQPTLTDFQHLGQGTWSVVIAATVTDQRQQTSRQYFQVPVSVSGPAGNRTASVLTLPAVVAGPDLLAPPRDDYPHNVPASSPVVPAVTAFLKALGVGKGDIAPYTAPGRSIPAIAPAPYADVEISDVYSDTAPSTSPAESAVQHILVKARGVSVENQQVSQLTYALTVSVRAGRWEVESIDPAPRLRKPATTTAPAGSR